MAEPADPFERGIAAFLITLAALLWVLWVLAWMSLFAGNPTAWSGIIGAPTFALPLTVGLLVAWRPRKKSKRGVDQT